MKQRLLGWWSRFKRTQAWRAWTRFGNVRGNLLASGIAFYGFFSIFPAVAVAAVIFGFVLRGHPELLNGVGNALDERLPGLVQTRANPDGLIPLKAPDLSLLTIGGVAALAGLLLAGVGWVGAMRDGIRAVFGVAGSPGNLVTDKLRDLGVLFVLGIGVLASAVLTSVLGAGANGLTETLGLGRHPVLGTVAGLLVGFAVDLGVMVLLLRVLSGVPLPWQDVRQGAVVGAVGLSIVKIFGVQLIAQATRNPVFGSIILVVGLLFWLNLIAKLILLSASWSANTVDGKLARGLGTRGGLGVPALAAATTPADGAPDSESLTDPRARAVAGVPNFGARTQDRTTLAAGAILGATAAMALGAASGVIRGLVSRRQD